MDNYSPNFIFPKVVALGTMHAKEQVLQGAFDTLGICLEVPAGLDTDVFGAFTGVNRRKGSMFDAARGKAIAAARKAGCDVGLGSECASASSRKRLSRLEGTEVLMSSRAAKRSREPRSGG